MEKGLVQDCLGRERSRAHAIYREKGSDRRRKDMFTLPSIRLQAWLCADLGFLYGQASAF